MSCVRRLLGVAIVAVVVIGSADTASALCRPAFTSSNGDGTCTTCYNTGEYYGVYTGNHYCSYDCSVDNCYQA
jgi:hypothetical protein